MLTETLFIKELRNEHGNIINCVLFSLTKLLYKVWLILYFYICEYRGDVSLKYVDIVMEFISIFSTKQFISHNDDNNNNNDSNCIRNKLIVFLLQLGMFLSQKDCNIAIKIFTLIKGIAISGDLDFAWLPLIISVYEKINCKDEVLEKLLYKISI